MLLKCDICGVEASRHNIINVVDMGNKSIRSCNVCSNIDALKGYFEEESRTDINLVLASEFMKFLKNEEKKKGMR